MSLNDLRRNSMMDHLVNALTNGQDIGHYGRLLFAMIARHFIADDELIGLLCRDKKFTQEHARALVGQVKSRGYSPPRRERILQWQAEQGFPICPNANDPDACNVYKDITFPESVYERIEEYYEQKAGA